MNDFYGNNNSFNDWDNDVYVDNNSFDDYNRSVSFEDTEAKIVTRSFFVMFAALLITAFTATIVATDIYKMKAIADYFGIIVIAEVLTVILSSAFIKNRNVILSAVMFILYSIINGLTMSFIFFAYELGSVQSIFLVTAILFGVMAVIGMFTRIDLSSIGGICTMALVGLLLVSIANMLFIHATGLELVIDYLVVLVFVGLTAYDGQKLKEVARSASERDVNIVSIFWGMQLYLDFINLFIRLLSIFGNRRD